MLNDKQLITSLLVMAGVVEARDAYTGGHLWRVASFSGLLARQLGLASAETAQLKLSGFLHDLGKVGVPDAVLLKPGKLTDQEYGVIKTHPTIGSQVIDQHPYGNIVKDVILHHHERIDGKGYPDGLRAEEISLHSRVVALVDAFDAMTSTRAYRKGMSIDTAFTLLQEERGQQFDAELVDAFLGLPLSDLNHIVLHSNDGVPLLTCPVCGPVIQVTQAARSGDSAFCGVCTVGFTLHKQGDSFDLEKTGKTGVASDLSPKADMEVVNQLVQQMPKGIC